MRREMRSNCTDAQNMVSFTIATPTSSPLRMQWAARQHGRREHAEWPSFASVWFAFNGWMECVTSAPNDRAMIEALATNWRVRDAYAELVQSLEFREAVEAFAELWPVAKFEISVKSSVRPHSGNLIGTSCSQGAASGMSI